MSALANVWVTLLMHPGSDYTCNRLPHPPRAPPPRIVHGQKKKKKSTGSREQPLTLRIKNSKVLVDGGGRRSGVVSGVRGGLYEQCICPGWPWTAVWFPHQQLSNNGGIVYAEGSLRIANRLFVRAFRHRAGVMPISGISCRGQLFTEIYRPPPAGVGRPERIYWVEFMHGLTG